MQWSRLYYEGGITRTDKELVALQLEKNVDQILSKTFLSISKVSKKRIYEDEPSVAEGPWKDWYTLSSICDMFDRDPEFFQDIFFGSIVDSPKINDLENCFALDSFLRAFYCRFIWDMRDLEECTLPFEALTESELHDAIYAYPDNFTEDFIDAVTPSPESCIFERGDFRGNLVHKVLLSTLAEKLLENVHSKEEEPLFKPVYVIRNPDEDSEGVCIRIKPGLYFDVCREHVDEEDRLKDQVSNMY